MRKIWSDEAWADYLYWQTQDKKTLRRINKLIQDIERNGYNGMGKPEPLKGGLSGYWSVGRLCAHLFAIACLYVSV